MIRVLLAEDHETVREGLRLLLDAQRDIEVVGEASDGHGAVEQTRRLRPDVVVLDLTLPGMSGLLAARALKDDGSPSAIVALTRHDDEAYVKELFDAGALAYILKQSPSAELLNGIRAAASGTRYVDPALTHPPDTQPRRRTSAALITEREAEVLRMMASGYSNKDVASRLDISIKTVEVHKANAMRKLGLNGRADVVRYAVLQGWLKDP